MKKEIKEKLEGVLIRQLDGVEGLAVGGELHQNAIDDISTTVSTIQEIEKSEHEAHVKERELKRDTIVKYLEATVEIGTLGVAIASLASRDRFIMAGLELEKTGTFTIQTLKSLMGTLFKK